MREVADQFFFSEGREKWNVQERWRRWEVMGEEMGVTSESPERVRDGGAGWVGAEEEEEEGEDASDCWEEEEEDLTRMPLGGLLEAAGVGAAAEGGSGWMAACGAFAVVVAGADAGAPEVLLPASADAEAG